MKWIYRLYFLSVLVSFFALVACGSAEGDDGDKKNKLPHYDLSKPERFGMPERLVEISGISFNKGKSDTIYAIQDEEGKLFRLAWGVKKQYHAKFAKGGDYEDVSIANNKVYILKSNGTIYVVDFADAVYEEIDSTTEWKGLIPKGEYESLFADEASNKLYVLCKNCESDDNKDFVSGYILQAGDSVYQTGSFSIDVESIKPFTGKVKRGFRPSALTKNPITDEWFILSAVNKLLVVTDGQWKVKGAYHLDGNLFNQPEGIAFDAEGNMYISNEGDDLSSGNILKFKRRKEQ
jgi:hypothetical protein